MDLNEISKDVTRKALEAIEIAKKTGKIKRGINEVTKSIERGVARLVVVALDVNPKEIIMHLPLLCKEKNIKLIPVPSREELGDSVGLQVPTSAVSIIKEGDSKDLIKELSA